MSLSLVGVDVSHHFHAGNRCDNWTNEITLVPYVICMDHGRSQAYAGLTYINVFENRQQHGDVIAMCTENNIYMTLAKISNTKLPKRRFWSSFTFI